MKSEVKKLIIGITLTVISIWLGLWVASRFDGNGFTCEQVTVRVTHGATLWQIAEQHCTGDIRQATTVLVETYGVDIRVGQFIALP
jgi:hypothetical protein